GQDQDEGPRGSAERAERAQRDKAQQSSKRAKVLARRRRTTMLLFLAFTLGTVVAAVGGFGFLWAPAVPGVLLSSYIVHLRVRERRRFAVTMDRRQAEAAARRLRERRSRRPPATLSQTRTEAVQEYAPEPVDTPPQEEDGAADRRALVEQTDHAEWVDQQRHGDGEPSEGWDPVPVPLPTYVSAPVAPRTARGVDPESPDTWSSARSSTAGEPSYPAEPSAEEPEPRPRRGRRRGRTPLFDQYEDGDRPRAANE
ncbi:MAG: divisome protein SepX/GlpR, partial [Gaiellales bacterium]